MSLIAPTARPPQPPALAVMLLTKPPMVKPEPLTVNPPPGPGVAVLFDAAGTISSSRSVLLLWLWLPRSTG